MPQDWLQSMEKIIALKLVNAQVVGEVAREPSLVLVQLTAELAELENKRSKSDPFGGEGEDDGSRIQHQGASIHAAAKSVKHLLCCFSKLLAVKLLLNTK